MSENKAKDLSWDENDTIHPQERQFFKGAKGEIQRIFPMTKGKFALCHFLPDDGYVNCNSTYEEQNGKSIRVMSAPCCELKEPAYRVGMVALVYDTKKDGTIQSKDYTFKLWVFGETVFNKLKSIFKEWGFGTQDLIIACTNEQFQKLEIQNAKDATVKKDTEWFKQVMADFSSYRYKDVSMSLAKNMTMEEMRTKLSKKELPKQELNQDVNIDETLRSLKGDQ